MEPGNQLNVGDAPLVDFDSVCQKIRAAVEPMRVHAVSLHDEAGDLLWLTESSMGPDEHNAVHQAFESFANGSGPTTVTFDLGDSRSAVLFRATNAKRAMVGAAMVIVDSRAIKPGSDGGSQLMSQKLLRALGDFAVMRRRAAPESAPPPAESAPLTLTAMSEISLTPAPAPTSIAPTATQPSAARPATVVAKESPRTDSNPITPEIDRLNAALRRSPIALHVQRLMPLARGSKLKRFEVLLRSKAEMAPNAAPQAMLKAAVEHGLGSMIDRRVVTELIGWLVRHPAVWEGASSMFSVNLTKTALHDEHFMKFVRMCLDKAALPRQTIAFEIDVPTAMKFGNQITEVASGLHKLGCPLVLDDFALRTECFALLRLPGVKYIKMAPSITAKMRTDKVSQASITALVQMSRVLGLHTVAKRTESAAEQEWLTALGVDFIQSNALSPPVTIESLAKAPNTRSTP